MDVSVFQVFGDTCDQVTKAIAALKLHKNEDGGYAYDYARIFEKQIEPELERQHYKAVSNDMKGLISTTTNSIVVIISMKVATRA